MQGFKPGFKPADKQKGGKIKGPGTGTSDSIKAEIPKGSYIMPADSTQQIGPKALDKLGEPVPVNVSNGEYQMPPEQVHAVGVQALNQMRDATHAPVAAGFRPQESELYFADGGLIGNAAQYWAKDNANFEAGSPSFGSRFVRALNPATAFGSAMGAMHTAAGNGDKTGMALAAAQAVPVFGAMRSVVTPAMGAIKAARAIAPSAAQTGVAIAGSGAAGAMADTYGTHEEGSAPQQAGAAFSDMQREPKIPRQQAPRLGFADGGSPAEEERRRLAGTGPSPKMGAVALGEQRRAERTGGAGLYSQANADLGRATSTAFPNTATAIRGAGQNIADAYQVGGLPAAAGATVRNTLVPAIGFAADVGRSAKQALDPAANALKTAVTGDPTPIEGASQAPARTPVSVAPAATSPAQQPAQQPASPPPAVEQPASTTQQPDDPRAMGPAPGMSVKPTAAPGISRIDNAPGLNSPLFTNLPAGQAVSGVQAGASTGGQPQAAGFAAQGGGAAARDQQASAMIAENNRIRQNRMDGRADNWTPNSAESRRDADQRSALQNRNMAIERAQRAQFFGRTGERNMEMQIAAMYEAERTGGRKLESDERAAAMREDGESRRSAERNATDRERVGVDRRRADSEAEVRGFEARGLQRAEKLYAAYENAKTPEERAAVAEQLRVLSGKEAPNRFTVVPGGQEISPQGMPYTRPSMVFNNQSGQFVDQQAIPGASAAPRAGEVRNGYRFKGGNPADQASWEKV